MDLALLWLKGHACALVPQACVAGSAGGATAFLQAGGASSSSPPSALVLSALMRTHQRPQECLRLTGEEPASAEGCHHCAQGSPAGLPSPARLGSRTLAYRWCKAGSSTAAVIHSVGIVPSCVSCLKVRILCFTELTQASTPLTGHCRAFLCVCFPVKGCSGSPWTLSVAAVPVSL